MAYAIPAVDDFKAQFVRDFPYSVPAFGALPGAATLTSGVITALAAGQGGQNYTVAPTVQVIDKTGTGAVITAQAPSKGVIPGFNIISGGANYSAPQFIVSGGAGDNSDLTKVTDGDINLAMVGAGANVNQDLFDGDDQAAAQKLFTYAFLFLTAHNLVETIAAATEGLSSRYAWLTTAKSVGDVSESFQIPERIGKDPFLASLSKTRYGSRYLEIISPLLIGNVNTQFRYTLP